MPDHNAFADLAQRDSVCQIFAVELITKHLQKHRAEEFVSELDGLLALTADGIGFVEDGGDAAMRFCSASSAGNTIGNSARIPGLRRGKFAPLVLETANLTIDGERR